MFFGISTDAQQTNALPDREALNQYIETILDKTQKVFKWSEHDDERTHAALLLSDSIACIGFKPINLKDFNRFSHQIDLGSKDWNDTRQKVLNQLTLLTKEKYGEIDVEYLMPFGDRVGKPYLNFRIFDLAIIQEIKAMPEVRYLEPMSYSMIEEDVKSGSGCSNYTSPINVADTTLISPTSCQSWHQVESKIDAAWPKCNKGESMWIAIMDTGVSATQSKLNGDFSEGDSSGRTIEKKGFYAPNPGAPYDGWDDKCGHGTAMIGLAAAPRGYDNTPAGVAYRANLISYRVSEDVVINSAVEKDGLSDGIYDAADDARVNIISMSLGDVFYNSQVADAIIYANNKGKMVLAAAGTSFGATSWFGVIFPASMNETVAVTGVDDATNRSKCVACHEGSEVDFVVVMERSNNTSRHGVTLSETDLEIGYVGGSSCATATQAGIAALIWDNNPSWDKNQVISRMIQTADNFPNRDSDHGWGLVDVCAAVDTSFSLPCMAGLSNEVEMEITNISFPSTFDAFTGEAEWVVSLNGQDYFFEVDVNGASNNPASFMNLNICGSIPMTVNLGNTSCGGSTLSLDVESFEDDGAVSDCNFDSLFDDDFTQTVEVVDMNNSTFVHESTAGDFIFTYVLNCIPLSSPAASIGNDTLTCVGAADHELIIFAGGGAGPYTVDYTINNGPVQSVTTGLNNIATLLVPTVTTGVFTYDLTNITDLNGCTQAITGSATVVVQAGISAVLSDSGASCAGDPITFTAAPLGYTNYEFFLDSNSNGILDMGESLQSGTSNTYTSSSLSNGDMVGVIISDPNLCDGIDIVTVVVAPSNYSLTGTVTGIEDFETDGIIDSDQLIGSSARVDYDSALEIELKNGFEVQVGGVFCAFIDGCNGGAGGVNVKEEEGDDKK